MAKSTTQHSSEKSSNFKLPELFSGLKPNKHLLHLSVLRQLDNQRAGTASTKTKAEVRGGGKKPWKQKGSGRARAGSIRSPLWRGGGIIFGPTEGRNFYKKVNKKLNRLAFFSVLTDRVKSEQLLVVDNIELQEAKTKELSRKLEILMKKMKPAGKNILIITPGKQEKLSRASANLPHVKVLTASNLNILDLLRANSIIVPKDALPQIEKTYL